MTMNVFPAIEGSSCYRYNNALHMSFHDHMHQVFAGYLEDYLKKLNLTQAIVDEYGKMWRSNKTSTERVPPILIPSRWTRKMPSATACCRSCST